MFYTDKSQSLYVDIRGLITVVYRYIKYLVLFQLQLLAQHISTSFLKKKMPKILVVFVSVALLAIGNLQFAEGHGMMLDPPGRSSMWRLGFPTPVNNDDNGLNCGGRKVILANKLLNSMQLAR